VIELARESSKSVAQISFLTSLRPHLVREPIRLWQEFEAMNKAELANPTSDKEKDATTQPRCYPGREGLSLPVPARIVSDAAWNVKVGHGSS